jgi:hypothetical protein
MIVCQIDPRPDSRGWAKRYGGPMKITAEGWIDFECAMKEWFARHRMSWGAIIDYRQQKSPVVGGAFPSAREGWRDLARFRRRPRRRGGAPGLTSPFARNKRDWSPT